MQIRAASLAGGGGNQALKNVNFIVAMHVLQNRRQALQAHARIHTRRGQLDQAPVRLHVKLHEHVVPDFNEPVAIFIGAAGRPAWNVVTVVIENLGTRAARAGVGHHPKVVGRVFFALVVSNADDAIRWQANFFVPNVVGLLVVNVDRGQQPLRWQTKHLGQQLPTPSERLALEVVAKTPVAQHLKKSVVAGGVAHVL